MADGKGHRWAHVIAVKPPAEVAFVPSTHISWAKARLLQRSMKIGWKKIILCRGNSK